MPRRPLLDPRHFRLDDLLRTPYRPETLFGPSGTNVWARSPQGWGFAGEVYCRRQETVAEIAPFALSIAADGIPVAPADAVSRPSHVTLHGVDAATGLQITEDKFITADDVVVSVLSFRNPSEYTVSVDVGLKWGMRAGERELAPGVIVGVGREAPPPDDRRVEVRSWGGRHRMVIAAAFAADAETAERRVQRWASESNPAMVQAERYQAWFDREYPRFDCPDPYFTKLWYYHAYLSRRPEPEAFPFRRGSDAERLNADAVQRFVREQFENGSYDRPVYPPNRQIARPAIDLVLTDLLGLRSSDDGALRLSPIVPDWPYFCIENLTWHGRRLTIVWDDPNVAGDYLDDGDKGLTIYDGDRVLHHQADLSPLTIAAPSERADDEDEE